MTKLTTLYFHILAGITFSASATEYNSMVDLSNTTLQSGDYINISPTSGASQGIFGAGVPLDISDSGNLNVIVNTNAPKARGINLSNSSGNNLGKDTTISVTSEGDAIGLNMSDVALKASGLEIYVNSPTSSIGVNARNKSEIIFNDKNYISVNSAAQATGINIIDSKLLATELDIYSSATKAIGVSLSGRDALVDFGANSSITVDTSGDKNSSGAAIMLNGEHNEVNAKHLVIKASGKNGRGIVVDKADSESSIYLGHDSSITTSGENGTGIFFSEDSQATLNGSGLSLDVFGVNSNGIEVHGGAVNLDAMSFIHSQNAGGILAITDGENVSNKATINLSNSAVSAQTVGAQASGTGASISLESSQITATDGTALQASHGGKISTANGWLSGKHGIQTFSSGNAEFTGNTTIHSESGNALESSGSGSLILGSGKAYITGNIIAENQGEIKLNLNAASTIDGMISTGNNSRTDVALSENSFWESTGNSNLTNLTLDNSTLIISGKNASREVGNTVTVNRDYHGNNGVIIFNSILGDDHSTTDKLAIQGDSSGTTQVAVNNLGGQGADTVNGIEVISVGGKSDGEFVKAGRIVAGAYEYDLVRGEGEDNKNWYLSSSQPGMPWENLDPSNNSGSGISILRPESGSYIDNLVSANTMFNLTMADRGGETEYIDWLTGERKASSLWLRQHGSHNRWRNSDGQIKTQSNGYSVQLGGDLVTGQNSKFGLTRLGIMVGYGNQQSKTRSGVTDYTSRGSTDGYSTGLYATWWQDVTQKKGGYVDTWLQYNWFNHIVNGDNLSPEKYKSSGISASVETGYSYWIKNMTGSKGNNYEWFVRPQAQVILSGVRTDNHQEANGTNVKSQGNNNLQSRVGVRTYLQSGNGAANKVEPFVEANWVHNYQDYQVQMDDVSVCQEGNRNIAEIKTGLDAKLSRNVNLWGNIALQVGGNGYNNTAATLGFSYTF